MEEQKIKVVKTFFKVYSKMGRELPDAPVTMALVDNKIEFWNSPFECKDEIKAMRGQHWCGYDEEPRQIWEVENCFRNRFQISFLEGKNPYAWFERPLEKQEFKPRLNNEDGKYYSLKAHQIENVETVLTIHYQIVADEMGLGKTLTAFEIMERSGVKKWWYVSRKKPIEEVKKQMRNWNFDPTIEVNLITYESYIELLRSFGPDDDIPQGIFFDEASTLKNEDSQRAQAAQWMADQIRAKHGYNGYVVLMSGTPSPKTPVDWWSLCEIAFPGFVREGSSKAFQIRMAIMEKREYATGSHFEIVGWRDNECRCDKCGHCKKCAKQNKKGQCLVCGSTTKDHDEHEALKHPDNENKRHHWEPSKNEVAYLDKRLKGLVVRHFKKDCLDLPEKQYRKVYCKPHPSTLRVAQGLVNSQMNAMQGLNLLRQLSDGFQYQEKIDPDKPTVPCTHCNGKGTVKAWLDPNDPDRKIRSIEMLDPEIVDRLEETEIECPQCDGSREMPNRFTITREVPCPKEDALIDLLDENVEQGRILIFAGYTGSVDRCVRICLNEGWDVVRCDGQHFEVIRKTSDGKIQKLTRVAPLDYWSDMDNTRVAFVSHPESGGQGLTLTEATMAVFWSNSYKPEFRIQAEDRIHRMGMKGMAIIVDLIHLPSDEKALTVIRENRRLELLSLGEVITEQDWDETVKDTSIAA